MPLLRIVTMGVVIVAAISCGGGGDRVKACETKAPTISGGFSGCIDSVDDTGDDQQPTALSHFELDVWTSAPSSDLNDGAEATYSALTDAQGFYELSVPAGHYWVCTSFRRCIEEDLAISQVTELDYEASVGPGWSER